MNLEHGGKENECNVCEKRFTTKTEKIGHIQNYHEDTQNSFRNPKENVVCRYFRNGNCSKGDHCPYKHTTQSSTHNTQMASSIISLAFVGKRIAL